MLQATIQIRVAVVIDRSYEGLVEGGEAPLFKDGEPTDNTQQGIEFCKAFEGERLMTDQFCERVKSLDLIGGQSAFLHAAG